MPADKGFPDIELFSGQFHWGFSYRETLILLIEEDISFSEDRSLSIDIDIKVTLNSELTRVNEQIDVLIFTLEKMLRPIQ